MAWSGTTVTAADVAWITGPTRSNLVAGEDLNRGEWVYADLSDNSFIKKASASALSTIGVIGVVLNDVKKYASDLRLALNGAIIDPGFAPAQGETYILGPSGGIGVIGQSSLTQYKVHLGIAPDTDRLEIIIANSQVQYTWS